MDLNMSNLLVYKRDENLGDTALSLDCHGYGTYKTATIGASTGMSHDDDLYEQDDGCGLVLGLGPTPSSYRNDYYNSFGAKKAKESAAFLSQSLSSDADLGMLKLGLSRGTGEVLSMARSSLSSSYLQNQLPASEKYLPVPVVDEGSTSAKRKLGGYMPTLLLAPRTESGIGSEGTPETQEILGLGTNLSVTRNHLHHHLQFSLEASATTDSSVGALSDATVSGAAPDRPTHHHHPKKCRFKECSKGARGASGLCIGHGGGQRCQKPGCNKGAESRTAYCKAHGGGRRCQELGCTKSAEGKTDFCIAHGGGRRCGHPGCSKAARGRSGLCIRHGGGKRCTVEGCARSAEGQAALCISHGGGRRCQFPGCRKGAQGSTVHCKAHGGGKRCIFEGCTKGAEGSTPLCKGHGGGRRCLYDGGCGVCPKSVHGGTDYCVAHGGGKRCAVPGCTKSARGRTDCCVRHGGGKRCRYERCGKSAQGSTDFCKAHGGGKRCAWGQGCEKFARGKSGLCAAHGSLIGPALFRALASVSTATVGSSMDNEYSSSGVSALSDCVESSENAGRRRQLAIPPQVLVPSSSVKSPSSSSEGLVGVERDGDVPEGRVHGGGLMSLFGGDLKKAL